MKKRKIDPLEEIMSNRAYSFPVYRRGYDCPKESGICFQRNQAPSVTSDSSMIRYTSDSKHHKR